MVKQYIIRVTGDSDFTVGSLSPDELSPAQNIGDSGPAGGGVQ